MGMERAGSRTDRQPGVVSVIVPTRNRPQLLRRAIESIVDQSYRPLEIFVVNDGALLEESFHRFVDEAPVSVTVVECPEHVGLPAARNRGLTRATGEFIAYLDDDDRFSSSHLATMVEALGRTGADLVYGDCRTVTLEPDGSGFRETSSQIVLNPDFDREILLQNNIFPVCCVVHRAALHEQGGLFDESLTALEDWDLWLRFSRFARLEHVSAVTVEIGRVEGRPGLREQHQYGYAWPALNVLYKMLDEFSGHERWETHFRLSYEDVLRNLIAHVSRVLSGDEAELSPLFSFRPIRDVIARLIWLESRYREGRGQLAFLRGLLSLQLGDFRNALRAIQQAAELAPNDEMITSFRDSILNSLGSTESH